jgi:hypothetical protein
MKPTIESSIMNDMNRRANFAKARFAVCFPASFDQRPHAKWRG